MTALSDKMKSELILQILKNHLTEPSLSLQEAYLLIKDSPVRNIHLLDFCKEICKSEIGISQSPVIDEINDESDIPSKKKWEEWPQEIQDEIVHVLSENDKGTRRVTMTDYLVRLRGIWNLEVTEHSLKSFCKDLGRKGWSK